MSFRNFSLNFINSVIEFLRCVNLQFSTNIMPKSEKETQCQGLAIHWHSTRNIIREIEILFKSIESTFKNLWIAELFPPEVFNGFLCLDCSGTHSAVREGNIFDYF